MSQHSPSERPLRTVAETAKEGISRIQAFGAAIVLLAGTLFGDVSSSIAECESLRWVLALSGTCYLLGGVSLARGWTGFKAAMRHSGAVARSESTVAHWCVLAAIGPVGVGLVAYLSALWAWAV